MTDARDIANNQQNQRLIYARFRPRKRQRNVTRLGLWLSLTALPVFAADLETVLHRVEDHYNHAKTLQVQFRESYTGQGRRRENESGVLTLRKPGQMRWDYSTPSGKLFLSDGKDAYLYTPEVHRVERIPLKEADDMRAPLAFLLGKLDFHKEFRDFSIKPDGDGYDLTATAKSDKLPYDHVEMWINPASEIRKLTVNGQDHSLLTYEFEQEKLNPPVDESRFRFRMPPGATLVEPQAGQ